MRAKMLSMSERPEQPAWGLLIGRAQKDAGLSARKAAQIAGISEGRWRQIVSGSVSVSTGVFAPVHGPANTVARMAQAVGVTPRQLIDAGREDAADELDRLFAAEAAAADEPDEQVGEYGPGSIRARVEELIRRRKLRQLDSALKLIEEQDGHRDAG